MLKNVTLLLIAVPVVVTVLKKAFNTMHTGGNGAKKCYLTLDRCPNCGNGAKKGIQYHAYGW